MPPFTHLHVHSHFSLLDGLPKIKALVKRAKELGMNSLAITDHGVMYGCVEFFKACKDEGIKPIIGVEAYVAIDKMTEKRPNIDNKNYHLILLAQDFEGYKNLMRLTSKAHLDGFYYKPRIDHELLKRYSKGLIGLSACLKGEVPRAILYKKHEDSIEMIRKYQNIFGAENFYLEMQSHPEIKEQLAVNAELIKLAKVTGAPLVGTNDSHYLKPTDAPAQDVLSCISTGKLVSDTHRMNMTHMDASLKSPEQMIEFFKDTPEAIENTQKIAERCNVDIPLGKFFFPKFILPENHTSDSLLREKALRGLVGRYKLSGEENLSEEKIVALATEKIPEVLSRLNYELDLIKTKGYSAYFLIVSDFAIWANGAGIITTTRGSAAGSVVSYCIGIIQINPLDYNLPFERFLNPFRDSAPDIDTDIEDLRRGEVIDYVVGKYGKDNVAQIITFGSMKAKGAVRDVGRALGKPYAIPDRISKLIPEGSQGFAMTLKRAKEESEDLKKAYDTEPETKEILDLAEKVEGCARHASVHAAGVVISPTELNDFCPLQWDTDNKFIMTQYEMKAVEDVGLVKMDFLGLRNLSMIGKSLEIIERTKGVKIDIYNIPLDDKKTYQMLSKGHTYGVFQLSGDGMTKYLTELKPEKITDIMAMVALYRPGPIASIPEYIRRKNDPSLVTYLDPRMEEIIKISYGIITYQDDVLMTSIKLAGYTWGDADKLRKAMGKKIPEEMAKQKEKFIEGAIKGGMTPENAQELFKLIEPFAAYGFNKAHACSYGTVAYQTAYLKANYTAEFMAAYMTCESGDNDKIAEAIGECRSMGLEVLPPEINESLDTFTVIGDRQIRFGFLGIKNIGEGIVKTLIKERADHGPFKNLADFVGRVRDRSFNKKNLESLAKSGCLDAFGERNQIISNAESILNYARIQHRAHESGQGGLFGGGGGEAKLHLSTVPAAKTSERLLWEKELLGVYITSHPFGEAYLKVAGKSTPLANLGSVSNGSGITVSGVIQTTKKIETKKGDPMMFVKVEDIKASVEIVVFPKTFKKFESLLMENQFITVEGKLGEKDGKRFVAADTIAPLTPPDRLIISVSYPPPAELKPALEQVVAIYPGDLLVYLRFVTSNDEKMMETAYRVRGDIRLVEELKKRISGLRVEVV
ncbi:MAG: DNA polymerase III subunit alpha [Parcubacteria group bacterium Gr01-1014_18]|nr:MAG: DNA polymerase III subunit alpha [Parcubacteria group bacterium Greene0416_36]TSC80960.1 MAG: DNA polymerase III subunit alpha [Parcubacteria group bacterium Gr01-1014_18]TSC98697.1 MAG: DNA polymerase III subunit alpha [Parcubacteria group bacterium Greene1014_20]TSD06449.1 MAG: DNA polymerase III subunit alpha [Parcubacteria group bacterium Greene0714_2]